MPGIKGSRNTVVPFELCEVIPGQLFKKQLTPDMATAVLAFATVKPEKRFQMISDGVQVCLFTISVRSF